MPLSGASTCLEGKRAGKSVTRQIPNFLRKLIHSNELWHCNQKGLYNLSTLQGASWYAYRRQPNSYRFAVQSTLRHPSQAFNPHNCLGLNLTSCGKLSGPCESSAGVLSKLDGLAGLFLCPHKAALHNSSWASRRGTSRLLAEKSRCVSSMKRLGLI